VAHDTNPVTKRRPCAVGRVSVFTRLFTLEPRMSKCPGSGVHACDVVEVTTSSLVAQHFCSPDVI
jgi:hypothetical protein